MKSIIFLILFIPSICTAKEVNITSITVDTSEIYVKCDNKVIRLVVRNEDLILKQDYIINFFESQCNKKGE